MEFIGACLSCDLSYFIIVCLRILLLINNAMFSFSLYRKERISSDFGDQISKFAFLSQFMNHKKPRNKYKSRRHLRGGKH